MNDDELDPCEVEEAADYCPHCDCGPQFPLGTLGSTKHYHCCACGLMWNVSPARSLAAAETPAVFNQWIGGTAQ